MTSGGLNTRSKEDIAADPVPVFRPGVYDIDDASLAEDDAGAFATGNTNNGLYRYASQRTSIQEDQFDTIRSPALGFHLFSEIFPLFRTISSVGTDQNPIT
jgi:hypothetical protein